LTKVLILRFSSIGDIVLTTPVIRCLKQQLPDAEIHYLTKPQYKNILEHNSYIDQLHVLDKPILQKAIELKQLSFDYIIDLHNNLRTRILKSILDVTSFSFDKLNFEKWMLVNLKTNQLPNVHIVDRYMQTVQALNVSNDNKGLDYFLPTKFDSPTLPSTPFIAFAIGAQHSTKKLPNQKIIDICKLISKPIILLGGKEDIENATDIANGAGTHVINKCGELSLHQSAFVLKHAEKVITHDTGLMHIAAAFKKEIISVWGNTVPEFGMTPYYGDTLVPSIKFEVFNLDCRPCSKIGFNTCPKGHFKCMNMQDTSKIAALTL
jgi:ADP-heptose:LPS heptosyltransferase